MRNFKTPQHTYHFWPEITDRNGWYTQKRPYSAINSRTVKGAQDWAKKLFSFNSDFHVLYFKREGGRKIYKVER